MRFPTKQELFGAAKREIIGWAFVTDVTMSVPNRQEGGRGSQVTLTLRNLACQSVTLDRRIISRGLNPSMLVHFEHRRIQMDVSIA